MKNNFNEDNCQDIIKEIYKLNIKYRLLESQIESYLGNGRNISQDILNKFLIEFRQNSKSRLCDYDKLKKRIIDIKLKTNQFKSSIENIQPNDEFVSSTKQVMEDIEAIITELKREQKDSYENLLRSEVTLWQECVFMEKKINGWSSGNHDKEPETFPKPSINTVNKENEEKNAILALQKYIDETGGKTGGWSVIDHQTFLRIRLKYTGIIQPGILQYPRDEDMFINDLVSLLAPKNYDDVKTHEIWYCKYQQLLADKKQAIAQWKQQKIKQTNNNNNEHDDIDDNHNKTISTNDWEKEKKRLENQRRALDLWRTEKDLEESRLKMMKDNQLKEERDKKRLEKERERKELKLLVGEYKEKKKAEEGEKKELEWKLIEIEKEEKKKQLEIDSARINERNTRMIEERIIKQHHKQFENEKRIERLNEMRNQVAVTARRDPSRLLKPTSVWMHRLAENDNNNNNNNIGSDGGINNISRINNVQHKAIPTWRRDSVQ